MSTTTKKTAQENKIGIKGAQRVLKPQLRFSTLITTSRATLSRFRSMLPVSASCWYTSTKHATYRAPPDRINVQDDKRDTSKNEFAKQANNELNKLSDATLFSSPFRQHLGAQIRSWSTDHRVHVGNASRKLLLIGLITRCVYASYGIVAHNG